MRGGRIEGRFWMTGRAAWALVEDACRLIDAEVDGATSVSLTRNIGVKTLGLRDRSPDLAVVVTTVKDVGAIVNTAG